MTEHPQHRTDALIDRALRTVSNAKAPAGLEARVSARLLQAEEARVRPSHSTASRSPFTAFTRSPPFVVIGRSSTVAVILNAVKNPRLLPWGRTYAFAAMSLLLAACLTPHKVSRASTTRAEAVTSASVEPSPAFVHTAAKRLQGRSLQPFPNVRRFAPIAPADNPDALALAETLAPSRPAPPLPLTAQERLLLNATRQGQPIELAELDMARQPALQAAAEAQRRATIRNYVHSLLGPLAAAEAINPTSSSPAADYSSIAQPPSSN